MPHEPPFHEKTSPGFGDLIRLIVAAYTFRQARAQAQAHLRPRAVFAYDLIGVHINAFGVYEGDSLDLLFDFLSDRRDQFAAGLALDIGANIGNHALYFAERFARVIAFEPNPTIGALLRFNADQVDNLDVRAYGLGDVAGQFSQFVEPGNLGGSSLITDQSGPSVDVEVRRLDDEDVGKIALIKIDVEGFETRVLQGAEATIKMHRPVVVFEQHARDFGENGSSAINFLTGLGYRIHWIEGGRVLSDPWLSQGLQMLRDIVLRRGRRIVTGGAVPAKTHSFLIAIPD